MQVAEKMETGPLSGVRVPDFTWVPAGPHATKTPADMGAAVVKVEQFKTGTIERHQPLRIEKNGILQSFYHLNLNRGKKNLCVNLKASRGKV